MNGKSILLIVYIFVSCFQLSFCQNDNRTNLRRTSEISNEERISELLIRPACFENISNLDSLITIKEVIIPSGGIKLQGELYLPNAPGPHPAVVIMHGGGNNYEMLMSAPKYFAPRLAICGYAALLYDKRGTGKSGGVFHESTFNDFVTDAGNAVNFLSVSNQIDPEKIGVYGGSQGGRLAPIVAIRFPSASFAISASGPIGSHAEQANFNMEYALSLRGYADSTIEQVMPLWRKHHKAWESMNPDDLQEVADEITNKREYIDPMALPNTRQEFLADSNLFFLKPIYNSMSINYYGELANLKVPWLAFYGELDPIVNVLESVKNIQNQMAITGNKDYEIIVFKNVGHSFENRNTGENIPTIRVIVNWLNEIISKTGAGEGSAR